MNQAHIDSTGASRGSFKSYATGFILSIILTVIPFALVMSGTLSGAVVLCGIFSAAILQILVHLHYFLHLDASSATRWNVLASLMLTFGGYTGYTYLVVAAVLGLFWLYLALSGFKTSDDRLWAKKLLVISIACWSIGNYRFMGKRYLNNHIADYLQQR